MTRIIVSMTTTPARLARIQPVILSVLDTQTMPVSALVLNLPKTYRHFEAITSVPAFLTNHARIVVNRACVDMGPATKITGLYSSGVKLHPTDVVIYIDDDHVLPRELVHAHVLAHQLCAKTVFGGRGALFVDNVRTLYTAPFFMPVHTIDGVGTVSFCVKDVLGSALVKAIEATVHSPSMRASDDVILSYFFHTQGLTLRIVPLSGKADAMPLSYAYGDDALSKGQFGNHDADTTARYAQVVKELDASWPALHTAEPLNIHAAPVLPASIAPSDTAFVLFAFNRPYYLEKVLQSLKACHDFDEAHLYIFLDGPVHIHNATLNSRVVRYTENMAMIAKYFPKAYVFRAGVNYGVGVMQHHAMTFVFEKLQYNTAVFLEDDLILGKHYLQTLSFLKAEMARIPSVNAVQGGYRTETIDPNKVMMLDARKKHVHYWGWLTTRERFTRMAALYHAAAAELFTGVDYMTRDLSRYKAWFARHGLSDEHCSQDWVRDGCFRLAGMPHKLVCAQRRAAPIGQYGLHSTPEIFKKLNLDPKTTDIHHEAPVAMDMDHPYRLAILHTPCPVRTYLGRFRHVVGLPFTLQPHTFDAVIDSSPCLRKLVKNNRLIKWFRPDFYCEM